MNLSILEVQNYNPFWDPMNEDAYADFADFDPKTSCHGNVRGAIGKGGQIGNVRSNTYHMVKIW